MKRNAFVVLGLLLSIVSVGTVVGKNVSFQKGNSVIAKQVKITIEEARKIALKKVDGKVEDEFSMEDDDENVTAYVFIIKTKEGKSFEVQIDADKGDVLSSEEIVEEPDVEDPSVN